MFDWKIGLVILNGITMLGSLFMFFIIKFNDLRHLTKDVYNLKSENKEFKTNLEKKLDKIFRRLGNIEKKQVETNTKLEERTKKR